MSMNIWRRGVIAGSGGGAVASPITEAALTNLTSDTQATSLVTATITPTANALVLAWVFSTRSTPPVPTSVTGCGITWTLVASQVILNGWRVSLFKGSSAAPTTGAVTVSWGASTQNSRGIIVHEFRAGAVTPIVVQFKTGSSSGATSSAVTLDNPVVLATSACVGGWTREGTSGYTAGSGFTIRVQMNGASVTGDHYELVEFNLTPTDGIVDCSWGVNDAWAAVVAEIGI